MVLKKKFSVKCVEIEVYKHQPKIQKASNSIAEYLGTVRHVPLTEIDESDKFDKWEVGQTVQYNVFVCHKEYKLLAKLKSKDLFKTVPGIIFPKIDPFSTLDESSIIEISETTVNKCDINKEKEIEQVKSSIDLTTEDDSTQIPLSKSFEALLLSNTNAWQSARNIDNLDLFFERLFEKKDKESKDISTKLERIIENQKATMETLNRLNHTLQAFMPMLSELKTNNEPVVKRLRSKSKGVQDAPTTSSKIFEKKKFSFENTDELSSKEMVIKKSFKKYLLTQIDQEIPIKDRNLGLDELKKKYHDSIQKIKENFENECLLNGIKDWKNTWNYAVNSRKKNRFKMK